MATGRLISSETIDDPDLNQLSIEAHLLYLHAITLLDRDGLITGDPVELWAKLAFRRFELQDHMRTIIREWLQFGEVIEYAAGRGKSVLFFQKFRLWNLNLLYEREASSKFPPPPGWIRHRLGLIPQDPDHCQLLADRIPGNGAYRKLLLQKTISSTESVENMELTKNLSCQGSGKVARRSYVSREEDQLNYGGDDDQINHPTTPGISIGGSRGGQSFPLQQVQQAQNTLVSFEIEALRQAAWELGAELSFQVEWHGYTAWLQEATKDQMIELICWLKRLNDDISLTHGINSTVALVRSHLKNGTRAYLTGNQSADLIKYMMQFVGGTERTHDSGNY